ncbi:MAG TPA: hypothetical protein VK704_01330 [Acidimicrobiales bacterium]|nr:hypothetical protein [Acidimicrobiales bacterium]
MSRAKVLRSVAALAACVVVLGAWGTQSEKTAMKSWVSDSAYVANNKTLINDAKHSATALRTKSASTSELHTVCAVMLVESEEANSALPTPDHLASSLLAKAYGNLGAGANVCYKAGASSTKRNRAIGDLSLGVAQLAEASARIKSDLTT